MITNKPTKLQHFPVMQTAGTLPFIKLYFHTCTFGTYQVSALLYSKARCRLSEGVTVITTIEVKLLHFPVSASLWPKPLAFESYAGHDVPSEHCSCERLSAF
jgi:hypothetical protein